MSEEAPKKKSSFKLDAGLTFVAQALVALCTYFQYRHIRTGWPDVVDFGNYSDLFRFRNMTEWMVLLVIPIALARQLPAFRAVGNTRDVRLYMWTGLVSGVLFLGVFAAITSLNPEAAAATIFGHSNMAKWIFPFNCLLFGYAFALMVNALMRGFQQFRLSNILLLCYSGFGPLACASLRGLPLTTVVAWNGAASGAIALLVLIALMIRQPEASKPIWAGWAEHRDAFKFFVTFGAPRLITGACTMVLGLSVPWFLKHEGFEALLSGVNAVYLVLAASAILVAGMSFVLLPHLSALLAKGEDVAAGRQLSIIIDFALFAGGSALLMSLGIMEPFLHIWVGGKIAGHPMLLIAGSLVIPCLLLLEILRGPMDAVSKRPWNAVTYGAGSTVAVLSLAILPKAGLDTEFLIAGTMVASYVVAASTALFLANRSFKLVVQVPKVLFNAGLCAILAVGILFIRPHLHVWMTVLTAVTATAIFVCSAVMSNPSWLNALSPRVARKLHGKSA